MKIGTQELMELQMMMDEDDYELLEPTSRIEKFQKTKKNVNSDNGDF